MQRFRFLTIVLLCLAWTGTVFAQAGPLNLVGSYSVSDGVDWTTNPPTYSCVEACAEVFGGNSDDYSCSTSAQTIDNMGYVDGWGDTQYCSTPVSEDFKLNSFYDCGTEGCSYSAYVSDHGCDSVNYCYANTATRDVPVMSNIGLVTLTLIVLLTGAGVFRFKASQG